MDLVDDDQLSGLRSQVGVGIVQAAEVGWALEIQVDRSGLSTGGDPPGEGCLPDLAGAQEDHGRRMPEPVFNNRFEIAGEHG
jgi:hypothetical protein